MSDQEPQYRLPGDPYGQPQYGYPQQQPQYGYQATMAGEKPGNHLALALITLLLFCQILGVVSLVYSIQVDSKWNSGDHAGARRSSELAQKWAWGGIISGAVVIVLYLLVMITVGASGAYGG